MSSDGGDKARRRRVVDILRANRVGFGIFFVMSLLFYIFFLPLPPSKPFPIPTTYVFGATLYSNITAPRFIESLASVRRLRSQDFAVVISDGSPDPAVRDLLRGAGAHVRETPCCGRKGFALRDALNMALNLTKGMENVVFAFQEMEKSDMAYHWRIVVNSMVHNESPIGIPMRVDSYFKSTYPTAQYHSEKFGNLFINSIAESTLRGMDIDWLFGPFAFERKIAHYWTNHNGEMWDAQILPMVKAIQHGVRFISVAIPFRASLVMRGEEEGNFRFISKRKKQLDALLPVLEREFNRSTAAMIGNLS
ncbi:hypothetical protein AAMO2058_000488900 [Amorphochlora amoebiformis]